MTVEIGLLLNPQTSPDRPAVDIWAQNMRLSRLAERRGFAMVAVPEHHGRPDDHMPQPLMACAALAGATTSIRVGTSVLLPALRHPVHVAEEVAVLDVLSGGRADIAIGLGNHQPEFAQFGLDVGDQVKRFEDTLDVLRHAWANDSSQGASVRGSATGLPICPKPVQLPHPPLWIGTGSHAGARRAGRSRTGLLLDPLRTVGELRPLVDTYLAASDEAGYEPRVAVIRWAWIGDDHSVQEDWWPSMRPIVATYTTEIVRTGLMSSSTNLSTLALDRFLVGSPQHVLEMAARCVDELSCSRLIVKLQGVAGPFDGAADAAVESVADLLVENLEAPRALQP